MTRSSLPFITSVCAAMLLSMGCKDQSTSGKPEESVAGRSAFDIIRDIQSAEEDVLEAIEQLGDAKERPEIWSEIANDERFSPRRRLLCLRALVRRHAQPGITLSEFARLLNKPKWLSDSDVLSVSVLGGFVPLRSAFERWGEDTLLQIIVSPAPWDEDGVQRQRERQGLEFERSCAIYLTISGKIGRMEPLLRALHGKEVAPAIANAKLTEIVWWEHGMWLDSDWVIHGP